MPANKRKSEIWNYFTKTGQKEAICKICNKELKTSGNTTNLRGHLENVHLKQCQDKEKIPGKKAKIVNDFTDYVVVPASMPETGDLNDDELSSTSNDHDYAYPLTMNNVQHIVLSQNLVVSKPSSLDFDGSKKVSQPKISNFIKNMTPQEGAKSKRITEALLNYIIMDNRPFSSVEDKGFLQLIREACPMYKVPSKKIIKSMIDDKYDALSDVFKIYIKNAKNYCITYDVWTERMQNKSFVNVTIHFLDKFKILSGIIGVFEMTESHTSGYVTEKLQEIFTDWNITIDKVSAIITDNDSTLMKVNRKTFGETKIIPCFAHTINLVVTKSINNAKNCSILIDKVRDIVNFFKRSVKAKDELRERQVIMGLEEVQIRKMILDVCTSWESCFYMLQRFLELVSIVEAILSNRLEAPSMITKSEIDCIDEMVELLCPFEKLIKEFFEDNYLMASKVIPLVSCVRESVENIKPKNKTVLELKEEIKKHLAKSFGNIEHSPILAISTALDPRFKFLHFKSAAAKGKVIHYLNNYVRKYNSLHSDNNDKGEESDKGDLQFDFWKYHKQLTHKNMINKSSAYLDVTATTEEIISETEVQMYLAFPLTSLKRNTIEIWDEMKSLFPALAEIALVYLPIVATSVPSEHLLSEATIAQDRSRIWGTRLSKLLFLNSISDLLHLNQ